MRKGRIAGIVDSLPGSLKQSSPSVRGTLRQKSEDGEKRDQKKDSEVKEKQQAQTQVLTNFGQIYVSNSPSQE